MSHIFYIIKLSAFQVVGIIKPIKKAWYNSAKIQAVLVEGARKSVVNKGN